MVNEFGYCVFAVDPGGTTGVCQVLVDLRQQTVAKCMKRAWRKGLLTTWTTNTGFVDQTWQLSQAAADWFFTCHVERAWIPPGNVVVVSEDFQPRMMGVDLTSARINAGLAVILSKQYGVDWPILQTASEAKGFCTDDMLREWGVWRGSTHERDAIRHAARMVDQLLKSLE